MDSTKAFESIARAAGFHDFDVMGNGCYYDDFLQHLYTGWQASRQALEGEPAGIVRHLTDPRSDNPNAYIDWQFGGDETNLPEGTKLYTHPTSADAEFDIQKECWRHEAEDLQALHRNLDDAGAPQYENGTELSAWGRVLRMNQNSASADAAEVWEKAMMAAIGEDGIKSVADAIVRLKAGSVPEETLTAIHDTLRLVWSRELSADDGMDEIEILIPPTKADEWIKCSERFPDLGQRVILKSRGVVQHYMPVFEQGDNDYGMGDYFWDFEDINDIDNPLVNFENDSWMPRPEQLNQEQDQ